MKKIQLLHIIPLLLITFLNSCVNDLYIEGNGELAEESRIIPDFSEISSSGEFHVFFDYAELPGVIVSCESNLLPYIETAVFNDKLRISTPNDISLQTHEIIEVYVTGPFVNKLMLSGSGRIITIPIQSNQLDLIVSGSGVIETSFYGESFHSIISGSGSIESYTECYNAESIISGSGELLLEGIARQGSFSISGSGSIWAYNFPLKNLEANISGSGQLHINVSHTLNANISGSGTIHYVGYPVINSNISGSGRIFSEN